MSLKLTLPADVQARLVFESANTACWPGERPMVDRDLVLRRLAMLDDYARLDPAIVIRVLRADIDDLSRFREAVGALV